MDLTTLDRVKRLIGAQPDDVAADGVLAQLITAVSAETEQALDRRTQSGVARTEYFSPRWGQRIFPLNAWPNASVTSVVEAYDRDYDNGTTLEAESYVVDDMGCLHIDGWTCGGGVRTLRVIHTGGMAATPSAFAIAYPDLASAVDHQIVFLYRKKDALGLSFLSMQGTSASFGVGERLEFQPLLKDAVRRHRREVAVG